MRRCLIPQENTLLSRTAVWTPSICTGPHRTTRCGGRNSRRTPARGSWHSAGMGNTFIWLQKPAANCMSCGTHPKKKKNFNVVQVVSTQRCDGYEGRNYAGGLHFHPSGKYLLATNRGHNSFAVFGVDRENGMVRLLGHKMLAGDHCREFAFTSDGKMLVAGLQHTDKIQSFFFDEKTGRIFDTGYTLDIPSPSAVVIFEKEMQE